ncbi:MAG: FecR domain-containing protein [Pseudomonadota bacterium]|nr:FecR domain-containing protein [Pseudomonadota bacterium]
MLSPERIQARDAEAAMWCLTLAEGELTAADQREFDAWISIDGNGEVFDEALRVWRAADQAADLPEVISVRTDALHRFRRANSRRWTRRAPQNWRWAGGIAAVLALVIVSVSLLNPPVRSYRTGVGERQVAVLADGTRLSLDADTVVRVRLRDESRDLILVQGRAKFDVARDPWRPFSVTAGDKVVVATGTSFSVEILRNEARVLLYEGHVAVLDKAEEKPSSRTAAPGRAGVGGYTALLPGDELATTIGEPMRVPRIQPSDPVRSLTWEGGQLNFDDEPLPAAVERVNRYSDRKVRLGDPSMGRLRVNGVFEAGDIDSFVEAVTVFNNVRVEEGDDGVTLRPS